MDMMFNTEMIVKDMKGGKEDMTEKRFTYEYDEYNGTLFDNKMNTFYHIEDSDENIEVLCDRLNWLVDENEQLKSEYKVLHMQHRDLQKFVENNFDEHLTQQKLNKQIIKLTDENEQLKSDRYRFEEESKFECTAQMNRVFDLIDKKTDELEGRYKFGQEVYKGCPMHNIRFGINTLKELKKELEE